MSARHLLSIRRVVREELQELCDQAWARLAEAAAANGANAWRFRSVTDANLQLEFLEYKAARDPRSDPAIDAALQTLERLAPAAAVEEWVGG
jgi:hypothetical protein